MPQATQLIRGEATSVPAQPWALPSAQVAHQPPGGPHGIAEQKERSTGTRTSLGDWIRTPACGVRARIPHATVPVGLLSPRPRRWHRTLHPRFSATCLHQHRTCLLLSRKRGAHAAFPGSSPPGGTKPSQAGPRKRHLNALPRPWPSSGAESARRARLPRAGSWGRASAVPCARRPGRSPSPRPWAHLSGLRTCPTWAAAPPPPGARAFLRPRSFPARRTSRGGRGGAGVPPCPEPPALVGRRLSPCFPRRLV